MGKVRLSEIAITIKELELIKWKIATREISGRITRENQKVPDFPMEYYWINEFPFNSVFCYVFGKYKTRKDKWWCFCPMRPCGQNCRLEKNGKHRAEQDIVDQIESIPIPLIMKYLKKIKFANDKAKIIKLYSIYRLHIKKRLGIWDLYPDVEDE